LLNPLESEIVPWGNKWQGSDGPPYGNVADLETAKRALREAPVAHSSCFLNLFQILVSVVSNVLIFHLQGTP
jgi:hypothetical protein